MIQDLAPRKISLSEWSRQFAAIDDAAIRQYRYYGNDVWGTYLFPPALFMVYGARELKRLKLDNSFAALRMWGFVFNETERLFRARQSGRRVIATMGDLGIMPVLVTAFPRCVPFYPECLWWTPFFRESSDLLDGASRLGIPEAACFSRCVATAFQRRAYFPKLDLSIASTGATCDDYSCVMQVVERLGYPMEWVEVPFRRDSGILVDDDLQPVGEGPSYHPSAERYLVCEYERVAGRLSELTQTRGPDYRGAIEKNNRLRAAVGRLRAAVFDAPLAPLPALELMTVEFGNLYGYGDLDEWFDVVGMLEDTVQRRVAAGSGVLQEQAMPIAWVSPSADPYLLNIVEDAGCRVVETEYIINQALVQIPTDVPPLNALARAFLHASLIGSTRERVRRIKAGITAGKIRGVLITNMLGASHCAMETRLIEEELGDVPLLSVDVPPPAGITEQLRTRIAAFAETLR